MNERRSVSIAGGGLAGLSLGLALARSGVPVSVHEAASYPRHKVCGEFITGLEERTIGRLGMEGIFAGARRLSHVTWFRKGKELRSFQLPRPAIGLSRFTLDARLAEAFREAGGSLIAGERMSGTALEPAEGRVLAVGRTRCASGWLGLKMHVCSLELASDLEFHLGADAYVGLSAVEGGRVNVCGLFKVRADINAPRDAILGAYLRKARLEGLADRIARASPFPESCSAVAGLGYGGWRSGGRGLAIGDAAAMIPPYTGNGMAMAFQAAEIAMGPLAAWSRREMAWEPLVEQVRELERRLFLRRVATATAIHPLLYSSFGQRSLAAASQSHLLPLGPIYRLLH